MDSTDQLFGISAKELQKLTNEAKLKEETQKLAAKLANHPKILSHLTIDKASATTEINLTRGVYGAFCKGFITDYHFTVSFDDSQIPSKHLDIEIRKWDLGHWYLTGSAESTNIDCHIQYKSSSDDAWAIVSTLTVHSAYGDPGQSIRKTSEGGAKTILKRVLHDLDPSSTLTEIQLLELLVNDGVLGNGIEEEVRDEEGKWLEKLVTLRDVIEHEIEVDEKN
jgi:hypothetical protein